jgi:hypothetical protein
VSSKITHLSKGHGDGWWRNMSADRELGLGLVTIAAGAVRFVDAKTVARSGGAFDNAMTRGLLTGPFASREEAEGRAASADASPAPAPAFSPPAPATIEEPAAPATASDPDPEQEPAVSDADAQPAVAAKKKQRRGE